MSHAGQSTPAFDTPLAKRPRLAIVLVAVGYALLSFLELVPAGKIVPPLLLFFTLGFVALVLMPFVLGLPNGRRSLRDYCRDIRLLPVQPVGRNILLGLLLALLTLSGILIAALLSGHFVLDWSLVPGLRWVKGLTRGIWEEVFFRGIILVLFMRLYPQSRAALLAAFVFAVLHLGALNLEAVIDLLSLFFMALLFTYVVLKSGSLLPAIVFHYVHDIFINLVQNTPGADPTLALALLYGCLWAALALGALLTKVIVERWPAAQTR
ncbi:MAG: CPBP family intramembrane glutamic endopeptidase [Chloroflexota bacterium]